MTSASVTVPAADRSRGASLVTLGCLGAVASVLGALSAGVILLVATDPMTGDDRYSYPFDPGWFSVAQVFFTIQHLAMLPLFAGLLLLERQRRSRALRIGTWVAVAGQLTLTAAELFALTARDVATTSSTADAVNTSYSVPTLLLGVGLTVAGVGALRTDLLPGAARWLTLALGLYVFVVLLPAIFGPMAAGRIAIGVWMLMFAALGLALVSRGRGASRP